VRFEDYHDMEARMLKRDMPPEMLAAANACRPY
jgi:hypothetical protein